MKSVRPLVPALVVMSLLAPAARAADLADLGARTKEVPQGLQLDDVTPKGLMDQLGLRRGDIIQVVNKSEVKVRADAAKAMASQRSLTVQYVRGGAKQTVRAEIYWPQAKSNADLKDDQKMYFLSDKERRPPVVLKKTVEK